MHISTPLLSIAFIIGLSSSMAVPSDGAVAELPPGTLADAGPEKKGPGWPYKRQGAQN
jgi:hypothetical protein